jgi:hypothetical protein
VDDKQSTIRRRYLTGWQARMNPRELDDKRSEIHERYLGIGVALGSSAGVAIGAGLGVALGNLSLGIGLCISLGVGLGIAVGSMLGDKHAKATQEQSKTADSRNA